MSKSYKVNAPTSVELKPVQYMKVTDKCADVYLRKNISTELFHYDSENMADQEMNIADEIYFQVDASKVSESDITTNFEKYWMYGEQWVDTRGMTEAEKIEALEAKNLELNQCILALCNMI